MKDLIIHLLAELADGCIHIQRSAYSICGSSIEFELHCTGLDGQPIQWHTVATRFEIIAAMAASGHILGHDPHTRQVYLPTAGGGPAQAAMLHDAYAELPDTDAFHAELLRLHLQGAMNVLNHGGDPEDLWPYFAEYSFLEKQALLWLLGQKPNVQLYGPRKSYADVMNHVSGCLHHFDFKTPLGVCIFARWLKAARGGLMALSPPPHGEAYTERAYTANVA